MIAIGSGTSTSAVNIGSHIVQLGTILVRYGRTSSCSSISSKNNATIEDTTTNGGTSLSVLKLGVLGICLDEGLVSETVVIVKATLLQLVHVVQFHYEIIWLTFQR